MSAKTLLELSVDYIAAEQALAAMDRNGTGDDASRAQAVAALAATVEPLAATPARSASGRKIKAGALVSFAHWATPQHPAWVAFALSIAEDLLQ